ncbi:MAG TPA: hypothetical protein VH332_11985, partial [Nitrospira sp.]
MFRQDRRWAFGPMSLLAGLLLVFPIQAWSATTPLSPSAEQRTVTSLRLSLSDALTLFVQQNLDVLIAKYGIE